MTAPDTTSTDTSSTPPEGEQPEPKTFDAEYVANLRKEAAKYRTEAKANADAAAKLAEIEAAKAKADQTAAEREAAAEKLAADADARALKLEVAFAKGLTPAQAKRLVGGTREELEADADEILVDFPVKPSGGERPKAPDLGQGQRDTAAPRGRDLGAAEAERRFGTPAKAS